MPIKIVSQQFQNEVVKVELIVSTIENNRERIRTIGNMMITTSGILIPASLAFLLFFIDKRVTDFAVLLPLLIGIVFLLTSSFLSILSSLLRRKIYVSDMLNFVESLLRLYNSELRLSYFSFIFLILGIIAMTVSVLLFVFRYRG
jgi:hypothetical protein